MSMVCYCGDQQCPVAEWNEWKCNQFKIKREALAAYNQGIADAQAKILWMLGGNKTLEELTGELAYDGSQMLCAYWAIGDLKK
jgi:hypothetical protein